MNAPNVTYVIADKLGGIASFTSNLVHNAPASAPPQRVVRFRTEGQTDTYIPESCQLVDEQLITFGEMDNVFAKLRKLQRAIGNEPGALISNDWPELAVAAVFKPAKTIFQIVHDEYNLGLSKTYSRVIDVMIAHSKYYYERLRHEFPERTDRIFHLPYGIPLSPHRRQPSRDGSLRLVFVGRLHVDKGVHDLPLIDKLLLERSLNVTWTIVGAGPEEATLKRSWPETQRVRYVAPSTNSEVLAECVNGDVFVLPTHFEGFPVALVEAMSAGLVPVVSDLPSGIPEVVSPGTGYRCHIGDCHGFAEAIGELARNRDDLERSSRAARFEAERFDIQRRAEDYHVLFGAWARWKTSWKGPLLLNLGSRLDKRWLPNWLVSNLRRYSLRPPLGL